MNRAEDSFLIIEARGSAEAADVIAPLDACLKAPKCVALGDAFLPPAVGRLHGFDLLDQPLISNVGPRDGELLTARTTLPLRRSMIGRDVLVVFDRGDVDSPIIVGVIHTDAVGNDQGASAAATAIEVDGERRVIEAEREIVLRCGEASITLTRAGKVIIKGNYILSRSTGYNKIKGAAIDIN